jgi:hypothetical protein
MSVQWRPFANVVTDQQRRAPFSGVPSLALVEKTTGLNPPEFDATLASRGWDTGRNLPSQLSHKRTGPGNGGQPRRVIYLRCKPLSQKPFPKRFPEMASFRRSYGNDRALLKVPENTLLSSGGRSGDRRCLNLCGATCDKPCRFVRLCGN